MSGHNPLHTVSKNLFTKGEICLQSQIMAQGKKVGVYEYFISKVDIMSFVT